MPPRSRFTMRLGAVLDHQTARRYPRHGHVSLERMCARSKGRSRHYVDHKPPSQRHVKTLGQRAKAGIRFDLELVAGDEHAVKSETGYTGKHGRAGAVLECQAHALRFGTQALE